MTRYRFESKAPAVELEGETPQEALSRVEPHVLYKSAGNKLYVLVAKRTEVYGEIKLEEFEYTWEVCKPKYHVFEGVFAWTGVELRVPTIENTPKECLELYMGTGWDNTRTEVHLREGAMYDICLGDYHVLRLKHRETVYE
jgi:hypothetical protein